MADLPAAFVELPGIGLAAFLAGSICGACAYPLFRRIIVRCGPAVRSLAALLYGLMGPASAVVVMLLLFQPQYADLIVPGHCHQEDCDSHAPLFRTGSAGTFGLVTSAALLSAASLLVIGYGVRLAQRRIQALSAFARRHTGRDYLIVETGDALAWCCGLWRPRIFLSRGLIERLTPRELDVVLAHERAHRDRLDNLRAALLAWSTLLWPFGLRQLIRNHGLDDAEHACDQSALEKTADRQALASAIATLRPRVVRVTAVRSAAFACGNATHQADESAAYASPFRAPAYAWAALGLSWFLQVGATTAASHFLVEWITSLGA